MMKYKMKEVFKFHSKWKTNKMALVKNEFNAFHGSTRQQHSFNCLVIHRSIESECLSIFSSELKQFLFEEIFFWTDDSLNEDYFK